MNKIGAIYQSILNRPWIGLLVSLAILATCIIFFTQVPAFTPKSSQETHFVIIRKSTNQILDSKNLCDIQTWYKSLDVQAFGALQSFSLFDVNDFKLENQAVVSHPALGDPCAGKSNLTEVIQNPVWNRLWTNPNGTDLLFQIHSKETEHFNIKRLKQNFNSAFPKSDLEFISFNTAPIAKVQGREALQFYLVAILLLLPVFIFRRHILVSTLSIVLLASACLAPILYILSDLSIIHLRDYFEMFSFVIGVLLALIINIRWLFLSTHSTDFHLHTHYCKSFHTEVIFKLVVYPLFLFAAIFIGLDITLFFLIGFFVTDFLASLSNRICVPAILDLLPGLRTVQNRSAITFFSHYRLFKTEINLSIPVLAIVWTICLIASVTSINFSFHSAPLGSKLSEYLLDTRGWNLTLNVEVHQTQDENSANTTMRELSEIEGVSYVENPFAITEETVKGLGSGFRNHAKQEALTQPSSQWFFVQPYSINTRLYLENKGINGLKNALAKIERTCRGTLCTVKEKQFSKLTTITANQFSGIGISLVSIIYLFFTSILIFPKSSWPSRLGLIMIATTPFFVSASIFSLSIGALSLLLWPFLVFGIGWGTMETFSLASRIREKNSAFVSSYATCLLLSLAVFFFDIALGYQILILILPLLYVSFLISATLDSTVQRWSWGSKLQV